MTAGFRVIVFAFLLVPLVSGRAPASSGIACGKVGIVDTPTKIFGFSTYTGVWTPTTIDSPGVVRLAGQYLGYLRTATRLYAYNPLNDTWRVCTFSGTPRGEDIEGGTAIFWSSSGAYVGSTLWTTWRTQTFADGEEPLGGGSGVDLALAWTPHHAYAFRVANGQWFHQALADPCAGGIASEGLGMVWTNAAAYSFDAAAGSWVPLSLDEPEGVSVTGSGDVGLVWTSTSAQAYSGLLEGWYEQSSGTILEGGSASGEIALLWGANTAFVFDANTGVWSAQPLGSPAAAPEPFAGGGSAMRVGPNPCTGDRVTLGLAPDRAWRVGVYGPQGRLLRSYNLPEGSASRALSWDRTDDAGRRVAAGTYWIRAESKESCEARRVVLID